MSYVLFLLLLLLAALVVGLARVFDSKISFEAAFKGLAMGIVMLPIVFWMLLLCVAATPALLLITVGILHATGLLPAVAGWEMWTLLPSWAWLLIGAATLFGTVHLYCWIEERRRSEPITSQPRQEQSRRVRRVSSYGGDRAPPAHDKKPRR
jgi:hypothetical protein